MESFVMDALYGVLSRQLYIGYGLKICCGFFYLLLSGCSISLLTTVAASPDGKTIAAAEGNEFGTVRILLYDASILSEVKLLKAEREQILSRDRSFSGTFALLPRPLAISFDSRFLAAAGRRYSVDVWELPSGRQVAHFPQLTGAMAIAFSPTANILAAAGPTSQTSLWSVPDGKLLAMVRGKPTSPNTAVAFSPDGKVLAVGDADRTVRLWALPDGKEVGLLEGHHNWVHSLSFSPDGKTLAVYAGDLKFWGFPKMVPLPPFPELRDVSNTSIGGHPGMFSPDGKVFAYFRTYVWYVLGLENDIPELVVFSFGSKKIIRIDCRCRSFTFSPDSSKLVTVGAPVLGTSPIKMWSPVTGERIR
jgi:WD40 repeat protein